VTAKTSLNRRITGGALLIAAFGILCSGGFVYLAVDGLIRSMSTSELTHLVDAGTSMVNQASHHAIVSLLRGRVEASRELVSHFYDEYRAGRLSEAEARARAAEALLVQRIGSSGYIYCLDSHGVIRVHPKQELVGQDMSWYPLSQQQLSRKSDYIEYVWKNPGDTKWRPKALYQAYFEPWDWLISASSYREEFKGLVQPGDFRNDLLSIKIGKTGYLLLLDKTGNVIVHPTLEGSNMLSARDANGREFVKEIIARKNGTLSYSLPEADPTKVRRKIAAYREIPEFDWILVSSAYEDELFEPLRHIRWVIVGTLFFSCLLALILSAWFGRGVVSAQRATDLALRSSLETMSQIVDGVPFALVTVGKDRKIQRANGEAARILKTPDLVGRDWTGFVASPEGDWQKTVAETVAIDGTGVSVPIFLSASPLEIGGELIHVLAFIDLSERRQLETELRHAQKLQAVGQLAAGIAHEINTPAQFVSDNIHFLQQSFQDLETVLSEYRQTLEILIPQSGSETAGSVVDKAEQAADLAFLRENIPSALNMACDGMAQISSIVRAMKEFAYADRGEKGLVDINHAITATLTVARNEYKYVADIETDFGTLPNVPCRAGEMNQVFLNLIINAAHAIADAVKGTGTKGRIAIRTSVEEGYARIDIADTGCGIPENIRDRIFEPFFTTKEVGRGSGQGLAIARSIVDGKHGGKLTFTSEVGKGTTFTIRIPLQEASAMPA
jgi:two-component system, NtrC family, sensor kinase